MRAAFILQNKTCNSDLGLGCFDESVEVAGGRGGVSAQTGALGEVLEGESGGGDVGQQHELLHHRVRLHQLLPLHLDRVVRLAVYVEPKQRIEHISLVGAFLEKSRL